MSLWRKWRFPLACLCILAGLGSFLACGSDSTDKDTSTDGTGDADSGDADGPKFNANIKPILDAHCSISGCHDGTQSPNYAEGNAATLVNSTAKAQVSADLMPKEDGTAGWTEDKKATLLEYLDR